MPVRSLWRVGTRAAIMPPPPSGVLALHTITQTASCRRSHTPGSTLTPTPWTPLLAQLRDAAQARTGCSFNFVLVKWVAQPRARRRRAVALV